MKGAVDNFDRFGWTAEVIFWMALTFVALSWIQTRHDPALSNDGYQYLSEAQHLLNEHRLSTSLVYFDVERSHGRIPAPLTTFPPGYPIAIAAFGGQTAGLEHAGRHVSQFALMMASGLLAVSLAGMGIGFIHRQLMMLLMVTNATILGYGVSLISEPLFTLFFAGAVAGTIWIEFRLATGRSFIVPALLTMMAASITCWIRYAGYFVIAALFLYALIQWLRFRNRQRTILLAVATVPFLSSVCLMLRNLELAGTWKGGNDLVVHKRIVPVLLNYLVSHVHLLLGSHAATFGIWEAVLAVGILVLLVMAAAALFNHLLLPAAPHLPKEVPLLLASCIAVYTSIMLYVGVHAPVSFGGRMFMPLIPLYILLFACAFSGLDRRLRRKDPRAANVLTAGLSLAVIGYAAVNARDLAMPYKPAPHEALASLYAMPAQNGQPMIDWVHRAVPFDEAILSEESQGTGFLLERPTVGLTTSEYSNIRWECETIRPVVDRFHIHYVVLYRDSSLSEPQPESSFVSSSVAGHPPCGFAVAAQSPAILVLRNQQTDR